MNVSKSYVTGARVRIAVIDDNQLLAGWRSLDDDEVRAEFEAARAERAAANKAALIALLRDRKA